MNTTSSEHLVGSMSALTRNFLSCEDLSDLGALFVRDVLAMIPADEVIIDVNTYDFVRPPLFSWNVDKDWAKRYNTEFHAINPSISALKTLARSGLPYVKRFDELTVEPLEQTAFFQRYMTPQGHRFSLIAGQPLQIAGDPVPNFQVLLVRRESRPAFSDFEMSCLYMLLPVLSQSTQKIMKSGSTWTASVLRNAFRLPPRLAEVAALIVEGNTNKDIAEALGLTLGTTKHYAHQVFELTGTTTRADLCRLVLGS